MGEFKKTNKISGKYKYLAVEDGNFFDPATGEYLNVAKELEAIYGSGEVFTLSTSNSTERDIDPERGDVVD